MFALFTLDKSMKKLDDNFFCNVGSREFMNVLIIIVTDVDTIDQLKNKILQLIQQWGIKFEGDQNNPLFNKVYSALKNKGLPFPDENAARSKLQKASPPKSMAVNSDTNSLHPNSMQNKSPNLGSKKGSSSKKNKKKNKQKVKKVVKQIVLDEGQQVLKSEIDNI